MLLKGNQKGVILLTAYYLSVILLILSAAFIAKNVSQRRITDYQKFEAQAFYLAEAGIDTALEKCNTDITNWAGWTIGGGHHAGGPTYSQTVHLGTGDFTTVISNLAGAHPEVISTGFAPSIAAPAISRRLKVTLESGASSAFGNAITIRGRLRLNGINVGTSSLPVPHQGHIYAAGQGDRSNVGIELSGIHVNVDGDANSAETVTSTGIDVNVSGNINQNMPVVPLPALDPDPYIARARAGGVHHGNYTVSGIRQTANLGPLYINGNLIIRGIENTVNLSDTIYVRGRIEVNGIENHLRGTANVLAERDITTSSIDYDGHNMLFFASLRGDITLSGIDVVQGGLLYAPQGTVNINGINLSLRGGIIANNAVMNGIGINIIRDTNLENYGLTLPASGYSVFTWKFD